AGGVPVRSQSPDREPPEISLVMPIYNEEENILLLLSAIRRMMQELGLTYEVICVDDGSTDKSYHILQEASVDDPHLISLRFRENAGQTAAMDAGFKNARGNIIVTLDGDLQNDTADIPVLLEALKEHDMVVGGGTNARTRG
ncbi:MAG: glycosyltransferase, partial [Candidatus Methylomirabilales bacterium]